MAYQGLRNPEVARSAEGSQWYREARPLNRPQARRWDSQPIPEPPLLPHLAELVDWLATLPHYSQWPTLLIDRLLLAPVSTLLVMTRDVIVSPRTHRVVVRLGVLATLFWLALAAAIVSYVGFYRAWVPEPGLRKDVWLQYGQSEPPFAHIQFDDYFFAQDQAYDVTLELGVPLNEANLDLGNFMVSLDLQSPRNRTLHRISKPTLLRYSPASMRAIESLSQYMSRNPPTERAPSDSQLVRISLLTRAVLAPSFLLSSGSLSDSKVTHARVQVGRHDAHLYWQSGGRSGGMVAFPHIVDGKTQLSLGAHSSRGELQTYSASLRFDAHLTGLRFFMYHYPLLSFFLFTTLFLAFEMATALTLWGVAAVYTSTMSINSLDTDEHFQDGDQKQTRVKSPPSSDDEDGASSYSSDQETETENEQQRSRRVKTEDDDASGSDPQQRSRESLEARDAAEYAEAVRQSRMRDMVESRRMTGTSGASTSEIPITPEEVSDIQLSHRVLDRLDEETEEDTEVGGSLTEEEGEEGSVGSFTAPRPKEEETESTIGGSTTSGVPTRRSFGATTMASSAQS